MSWNPILDPEYPIGDAVDAIETVIVPRARDARIAVLRDIGVSATQVERLHGPVGLIPSARDARTLAVSVLADVLAVSMKG